MFSKIIKLKCKYITKTILPLFANLLVTSYEHISQNVVRKFPKRSPNVYTSILLTHAVQNGGLRTHELHNFL